MPNTALHAVGQAFILGAKESPSSWDIPFDRIFQ